jgi:hypothetical protein
MSNGEFFAYLDKNGTIFIRRHSFLNAGLVEISQRCGSVTWVSEPGDFPAVASTAKAHNNRNGGRYNIRHKVG